MLCSLLGFASKNAVSFKNQKLNDTTVGSFIKQYLGDGNKVILLAYPKSVRRFYSTFGMEAAWVVQSNTRQTWQAMMLLDCVLQYGLTPGDYHPRELLYDPLHTMIEEPARISNAKKAKFDILLTDALIALMNNLHYGKLNPQYSADLLDDGLLPSFHAEVALLSARQQVEFIRAIEMAQPHAIQYTAMQDKLRQLRGVYKEDCYETPETEVTKIAINMERLRWAAIDSGLYIQVNIPSYTLTFVRPETTFVFKVVVGKTTAPTPTLNSNITYVTTFPEWKIAQQIFVNELLPKAKHDADFFENNHYAVYDRLNNYIAINPKTLAAIEKNPNLYYARQSFGCDNAMGQLVFHFQNMYDIYLHDTPEQQMFDNQERPLSHTCIRVEKAWQLAGLVIAYDGDRSKMILLKKAVDKKLTRNISLRKPVPIKITYLTCEVKEGQVINYKDIYDMDKSLEFALYHNNETLTIKLSNKWKRFW